MGKEPKKHHYLPQFYLKGFSANSTHLTQVDRNSMRHHGCNIKDVAAIRDYHEIDDAAAADPYGLEKGLAQIEAIQAKQLSDILSNGIGEFEQHDAAIHLLSSLRMRVPAMKQHFEAVYKAHVKSHLVLLERAGKLKEPPAAIKQLIRGNGVDIAIANWKCLEAMFKMAFDKSAIAVLQHMRATLYRAPFGESFYTSDQPVSLYHAAQQHTGYGVGYSTPGVEVCLPLSRFALLKLDHKRGNNSEKTANSEDVFEFNRRTISMTEKYVFIPELSGKALTQIENCKSKAGFEYNQIDTGKEILQYIEFNAIGPES